MSYQQVEISDLHRQLSKSKELQSFYSKDTSTAIVEAKFVQAQKSFLFDELEYYRKAANDAESNAAFAQQQRDNAYIACNSAQALAVAAAGQVSYYEELLKSEQFRQDSVAQKLIDTRKEVVEARSMNIILVNEFEEQKKENADQAAAFETMKATIINTKIEPNAATEDATNLLATRLALSTAEDKIVKLEAELSVHACEIAAYFALPKEEQKSRNQPNAGECPCYLHVSRALSIARTFDQCLYDELANINFKQMCTEDELHSLKRGVMRPRAEIGIQTEEMGEWNEVEEDDIASGVDSEDSFEIILTRASSSPVSSVDSRR
jgi:hypothetical protein